MKAMIRALSGMKIRLRNYMTEKDVCAITNIMAVLEKVDDLADAYDVLERDVGNEEGN